jgi:hypothetical protein
LGCSLIDLRVQKTETYSGIEGITTQEPAIQQSMGLIRRSKPGASWKHLIRRFIAARRLLLQAARTVLGGGDPPGIGTSYYAIRAVERVLPDGLDRVMGSAWRDWRR